jgi:hypothetical protein
MGLAFPPTSVFAGCQHVDSMNRYEFHFRITADQYLGYYRGTARSVVVRCTTGQNVQFAAPLLQEFV